MASPSPPRLTRAVVERARAPLTLCCRPSRTSAAAVARGGGRLASLGARFTCGDGQRTISAALFADGSPMLGRCPRAPLPPVPTAAEESLRSVDFLPPMSFRPARLES